MPYVATRHLPLLPAEAREHEPRTALDGGADGLDVFRAVVAGARDWLAPGGILLSEITEAQAGPAVAAVRGAGLDADLQFDEDLEARVILGRKVVAPGAIRSAASREMKGVGLGLLLRIRRARLAGQVIRRLRRAGLSDARYDARGFRVRFTPAGDQTPAILELAPLLAARGGGRRERLDRFVAGLVGTPRLPQTWAEARPLLRPVLRGGTPGAPLCRPVLPFLSEFVVVDQPDTMTYVGPDQPAVWGVSAEEVFEAARANLSGAVLHGVAEAPVVVRFVDDGDAYWTSHLLLRRLARPARRARSAALRSHSRRSAARCW